MNQYLKEVKWVEVRPTQEEASEKLSGVRAENSGLRMEVRVLYTMEHGRHVAITVCDKQSLLIIKERILLKLNSSVHESFAEGKRRAEKFADTWLGMLVKN